MSGYWKRWGITLSIIIVTIWAGILSGFPLACPARTPDRNWHDTYSPEHQYHDEGCATFDAIMRKATTTSLDWIGDRISRNPSDTSAIITMLATVAIAAFTIVLTSVSRRQADLAKGALTKVKRAFVFLDGFDCEITTAADAVEPPELPERYRDRPGLFLTRFAVQPRLKNGGTTPTRGLFVSVDWREFAPSEFPPDEFTYAGFGSRLFLAPQAVEPCGGYKEIPSAHSWVEARAFGIKGTPARIMLWGRADYEDVFGKPHFAEWCYELRFDMHDGKKLRATFSQIGPYNGTDEDTES